MLLLLQQGGVLAQGQNPLLLMLPHQEDDTSPRILDQMRLHQGEDTDPQVLNQMPLHQEDAIGPRVLDLMPLLQEDGISPRVLDLMPLHQEGATNRQILDRMQVPQEEEDHPNLIAHHHDGRKLNTHTVLTERQLAKVGGGEYGPLNVLFIFLVLKEATKEDRKMTNLELINEKNKSLEQNFQWGRSGVVQRLSAEEKRQQDLKEMQKPMARYADDEDLNKWQKEQQHWGDPMLEMNKEDADDGMEEELWKGTTKDDGEKKPEKKRPLYTGPAGPPNRYKIRPGYRWDGVDRSNGFEATMFKNSNKAELRRKEHYKWSVEDM
eukprot:TRINITY_DN1543_c0_g1_i1.p1 TRINITY_DN1543_c0_g1~~TRINITY_DN1543_c0_g1_i1.p1  ORF type:complete len:322 (-),score=56.50 TRINITY_DN1543_c0_g1_i1:23-988(-)